MKKFLAKAVGCVLAAVSVFSLASCSFGGSDLNVGKEYVVAPSQLDALMKLDKGEADVAVIDSVMAGYYTSTGDYASKMQIVDGVVFEEESYGIAAKKGNDALMSKINEALIAIRTTDYTDLVNKYNLASSVALTETTKDTYANATDDSWTSVVESKKLVVGYTIFAPIAYEENNALTGFDIELAEKTVEYLNETYDTEIELEFTEIDWSTKEAKLADGTLDLVWNGMTITEQRSQDMCISIPYLYNKQVAVVKTEDLSNYTDKASFKNAVIGVEVGSAGESVVTGK